MIVEAAVALLSIAALEWAHAKKTRTARYLVRSVFADEHWRVTELLSPSVLQVVGADLDLPLRPGTGAPRHLAEWQDALWAGGHRVFLAADLFDGRHFVFILARTELGQRQARPHPYTEGQGGWRVWASYGRGGDGLQTDQRELVTQLMSEGLPQQGYPNTWSQMVSQATAAATRNDGSATAIARALGHDSALAALQTEPDHFVAELAEHLWVGEQPFMQQQPGRVQRLIDSAAQATELIDPDELEAHAAQRVRALPGGTGLDPDEVARADPSEARQD